MKSQPKSADNSQNGRELWVPGWRKLTKGEAPVCCINIGTVTKRKASMRSRAMPADFVSELPAESALDGV